MNTSFSLLLSLFDLRFSITLELAWPDSSSTDYHTVKRRAHLDNELLNSQAAAAPASLYSSIWSLQCAVVVMWLCRRNNKAIQHAADYLVLTTLAFRAFPVCLWAIAHNCLRSQINRETLFTEVITGSCNFSS